LLKDRLGIEKIVKSTFLIIISETDF